ncbi:MAG: cobalamin-dependent protein [Thermoleophilia bacterium]|nr:cobalamin-dependent protein [Thermoleophilia bacterium]
MARTVADIADFTPIFVRYDVKIAPKKRGAEDVSADPVLQAIARGVVDGDEDVVSDATDKAIAAKGPETVIDTLIAGMREVSKLWDDGVYFLPQVILSSDALMVGLTKAEDAMGGKATKKGTVVMHCAHGDIHDIGKNIAAALIRANGFLVIDLGSDVPEDTVVKAIKDNKAHLVTGTALMTTTMSAFAKISDMLKKEGVELPFVCGGGAVSEEYVTSYDMGVYADVAKDGPGFAADASSGMSWQDMRAKWNLVV